MRFCGCVIVSLFCRTDDCTVNLHLNVQCRNICDIFMRKISEEGPHWWGK